MKLYVQKYLLHINTYKYVNVCKFVYMLTYICVVLLV